MTCITKRLFSKGLIDPPRWLPENIHMETIMGSQAYGVAGDDSDCDVYGFCLPPREIIFPHLAGVIHGFDKNFVSFEQFQAVHIEEKDHNKEWDLSIYSIVKYFRLCADGNPNMIDSLFTRAHSVLHMTPIGQMVREKRKLFLSMKCWHTFKGYAYAQMSKIKQQNNATSPKRKESIEKHGYDVKFGYHVVRLLQECEQIMLEGDLDLIRGNDVLRIIRAGEWTLDELKSYFDDKIKNLEAMYPTCTAIPHSPPWDEIKDLLISCLEHHYGSLAAVIPNPGKEARLLNKIREVLSEQ